MRNKDVVYKVAIFKDGDFCQERCFEQFWKAAQWMDGYANSGLTCFSGYVIEIKNGKEKTLYGF